MSVSPLGAQFRERFEAYPTSEACRLRPVLSDRVASAQHKWRMPWQRAKSHPRRIVRPFTLSLKSLFRRDAGLLTTQDGPSGKFSPRFSTSYQPGFDGYYQGIHAGRDAASGLGYGMVPNATSARGEAFGSYHGGQHAGRDAASGLGPGMVPNATSARGEAFGDTTAANAGRGAASNLGPGMVPMQPLRVVRHSTTSTAPARG